MRSLAAHLLSTAAQNNRFVQAHAHAHGVLSRLLHAFASEENGQARAALLGAASSLLRGLYFPLKSAFLHEMGGLELLQSVLDAGEERVARKALVLLLDLQLRDVPTSGTHFVKKTLTADGSWARRLLQLEAKTHDSRVYALKNLACLLEF